MISDIIEPREGDVLTGIKVLGQKVVVVLTDGVQQTNNSLLANKKER